VDRTKLISDDNINKACAASAANTPNSNLITAIPDDHGDVQVNNTSIFPFFNNSKKLRRIKTFNAFGIFKCVERSNSSSYLINNNAEKHLTPPFMHDINKAKMTDKNFRDDHREVNRLLANTTGNNDPSLDVIGAHNLPLSGDPPAVRKSLVSAVGRPLLRTKKQTKDNKSPKVRSKDCKISVFNFTPSIASVTDPRPPVDVRGDTENFEVKRRRLLSTPTNLLHNIDRGGSNLAAQTNTVSHDASFGIGTHSSRSWLTRLFHPPET